MAVEGVLEGLHAIATFYDELCPIWEGEVQDVGNGVVATTHDDIMEGVQGAMLSALATMEGRLGCRELEVMERLCNEGGDILSQIKIATFHAFCHQTAILQAIAPKRGEAIIERSMIKANQLELEGGPSKAGFLMKHIRSILWLIGLEADARKYYKEAAFWLKETLIDRSGQFTGLRRGWCFHLRYALGNCLYQIAFHNCDRDPQMQKTVLNMALPELASCGREIAQQTKLASDHQDASWALTTFGKLAKVIIKLQEGTNKLREVGEVYNEVAMYARKLGRGDLGRQLSQLCSGLRELEDHKRKLERRPEEFHEESEELDESGDQKSAAAAFKIFVEVLRFGVKKLANESDDLLESIDLLSHACWWTKESMQSLGFEHLALRFKLPEVERIIEAKLEISMLLLGMALTVLGEEREGLHYMESAYKIFESDPELSVSLHNVQHLLGRTYADGHATKDHRKAAEMFESVSKTAKVLQTKLTMAMEAASEWVQVPEERVRGVEKIQATVQIALQTFPCEWELQAALYFHAGSAHLNVGDEEEAVAHMEVGANLCVANDFSFTPQESREHDRTIVIGLAQLLALYSGKENLAAALALHKAAHPALAALKSSTGGDKLWKDTAWRNWQQALDVFKVATGIGYDVNVKELESSSGFSWDISELMLNEDIGGSKQYLFAIADRFQALAETEAKNCNWAGAVGNMDILEEKLHQRGVLSKKGKVALHRNRAYYWWSGGELSQALEEIQKAVEMMHGEEGDPTLVEIYTTQAGIFGDLQDVDAAHASLDKAEKACDESIFLRKMGLLRIIRLLRAKLLKEEGKYEMAEELAREVAISYAHIQSELGLESAWVHYLDNTAMGATYDNVQFLYRAKKDALKGLIWAERGRARLFMHLADQLGTEEFDRSDQFAEDIMWKGIELCGPDTVIIECTVFDSILILYGLFLLPQGGVGCYSCGLSLDEFFNIPENRVAGKKLTDVVVKVRQHIRAGQDEKALPGLTILHTILVQNMLNKCSEWLSSCSNIIFSPQGMLHLVPFMALYDGTAKKFLIEQKAVSVIPSIRALVHCFASEQKFGNRFEVLDGAFIAGNPEPMGVERLSFAPLPGAVDEAQKVAKILGVEACIGENVTKEAVVKALSKSSIVLLATHGLTRKHNYPFGAVLLRRARLDNNDQPVGLGNSSDAGNSSLEQHEVLTSEEIASIEGGISAGLVVLSACFTGVGEVSREGLLGLGHALLQAGASSAIVDLWDVNDGSVGILIADVFKELKKGTDILHSVQKAVVDMLRGPKPRKIQDWSALTLLGSPSFKLPDHMHASKVNLKQESLDYYSGSQLLADDIGGSTLYMTAVVHYYEDLARQRQDEGDFDTAIAAVNILEEDLQRNGLVSAIAKSKLHLWRGKIMNHLHGHLREALKELQKAIEVLLDLDKTPGLVADVLLEQARAYLKLRDCKAASAALDRALESVAKSNNNMLLCRSKMFRSFALSDDRDFKAAASLVREAQLEARFEGEHMWIPFVDDAVLLNTFSSYEMLSYGQGDLNKAVVWVEQGHTIASGDDIETDSAAAAKMLKTVALCGPNTIIIKFSYHHQNLLMLYGLSSKVSVCSRKYLKKFFSEEANCVMGTNLVELVSSVRQYISKGEDEIAVRGLSILYNLLVQPIVVDYQEFFDGYTKIIFAPQGFLCKVPFAALYDAREGKFLVEQMAVGVIPSLRSLQRCFSRQHMFESGLKPNEHSNAFVGGNSESMGLGLEQFQGTGQTAQEVAGILNVEPFPGENLTKEVLLKALSTCNIVMLATVAVGGNREQPYPYGAMVLKQDTADHDQVLTCEEIAALAGKIRASLVVTIACYKGQQEEAFVGEGLLGVGHAALEAGVVTAIASLWDIDDDVSRPLISSMFRELKKGSDVLFSMQKAMKDTARLTEIRHWASLTVLGSPTLHMSTPAQTAHQPAPARESQNPNAAGTPVSLDTLRKNCLQMLDVPTELGPLNSLPQHICEIVLQNLAAEEIEKLKEAEQEERGPVAEIMGCGYLGMVYGGMGEWSTARRWLVRSLSVAKDTWDSVKDNLEPDPLAMSALYISFLLRLHGTSSLNLDLDLVRFVLRSTDPTNKSLFNNIHQLLAIWE